MNLRSFLFLLLLAPVAFSAKKPADILEYSAFPDTTNNFAEASFSCLVPHSEPKAILFLAGGTDSDARPWLNDPRWRIFAEKERLVLVAACLRGAGEAYEVASGGSGQALLDAIAAFAKQSGRPVLERLPLIMYGHSAGAQFGFNFACWKPKRVRAIVCVKSGPLQKPPRERVPAFSALFIVGERDEPGRVREVARAFASGRSAGASWCLAVQPKAGHGSEGCRDLAEEFIEAINSATPDRGEYADVSAPDNLRTNTTTTRADSNWSWLPNASFARAWRGFAKGVPLPRLLTLPDDVASKQLSWRPIAALPDHVEGSKERVRFEYMVSLPEARTAITEAKVTASTPAITAIATRRSDHEWIVTGECDFREMPLGPFKSQLRAQLTTASGAIVSGDFSLFTRITGPVSVSPSSLYYGVIHRGRTEVFQVDLRAEDGHNIRSCEAVSSDPQFISVALTPSDRPDHYHVSYTIASGTRVGTRHGQIEFTVQTDRQHLIVVPYYGFVQK